MKPQTQTARKPNPFQVINRLKDQTREYLLDGHIEQAQQCFFVADKILREGDPLLKLAVSNIYVYALTTLLNQHPNLYQQVLLRLPSGIRQEMRHQRNVSGL